MSTRLYSTGRIVRAAGVDQFARAGAVDKMTGGECYA